MWDSIKNEIIRSHHYRENFSNPMSEWLFENYNGKGVTLSIVMPPVLFFICMLVSYFGNGMVILATIRKTPVMCSIIDSMGAGALPWFNTCVLLNILDVLIYTIVWIQLKVNTKASDTMRRVFKSLLVMMMVVGFGWLINALVRSVIIPYGHIPVSQWFFWASYCGFLVNIASTLNFFILFWFSSEYQAAFISLIPWLARFRSSDVQALPSSYNDRSRSRVDRLHSIVKNGSSSQYDNIL
ncbi:unnamed protein product [Bursaphelenchus okinawaensis]|uniref:G_PROTEIN_RECEP_F1_2 domain-containing protein n=1 Tax=Bursaphelenchus okinawaensis TaxID=465554 RepID=A0A811LKF9_9BILA|nr:unnamed protein product [Bursaphelenchus okinawaensis]CAG9124722.1 unnamed protein product [Bursaphelenchus okinawaensis]